MFASSCKHPISLLGNCSFPAGLYFAADVFISPPGSDSFQNGLMFYCRCFFFFQREISDLRRLIPVKFCTMISSSQLLIDLLKYFKRSVVVVGELLIFLFI